MESYKISNKLHKLTQISIVENTDGIHNEDIIIGYIAEDPFVVLSAWINKYLISYYNEKLYPVGYCSFKYTIKIKDVGSMYEPRNIMNNTSYFRDIDSFENMNNIIKIAMLTQKEKDEYFSLLSLILEKIPSIQKAIDNQDKIDILYSENSKSDTYITKILLMAKNHEYGIDCELDLLMSYIIKTAIEKLYE